jgi:O-antigen/teichoic acid export membrane protein/glycosyltransferase involved in cell wall biosynthesis/O-antigen ligase
MVRTLSLRPSAPLHEALALILRWFLLLLLVVLPLDIYIVLPPQRPIGFLSQILAAEALIVLVVAALAARFLRRATPLELSWRDAIPLGVILLASLISAIGATSSSDAAKGCLKVAAYFGIYLLARAVRSLPGMRAVALTTLLLGALVVIVAGPLTANANMPDLAGVLLNIQRTPAALPGSSVIRAEATFRYPNELAAYLLLVLPLLLAYALRVPSKIERLSFWVLTAFGFWGLTLTYTRGAVVAFFIVCPILFFLLCDRKVALGGAALTLVAAAGLALYAGGQSGRFLTVLTLDDSGYTSRFATWGWALDAFLHHPLVGVGLDNLRHQPNAPHVDATGVMRSVDAENLYLNALAELGLLGAIPVFAALAGALRRAWRGLRAEKSWIDASWNAGVLAALIGVLIYGLVDPVLVSGQVTGLLCALVGLSGPLAQRRQLSIENKPSLTRADALRQDRAGQFRRDTAGPLASRVVFLINARGFGGVEKHTYGLAAELRQRGVDTLVVCPPGAQFISELDARGIPYRTVEMGMNVGRLRGWLGTLMLLSPLSRRRSRRAIVALADETPSIFFCPFPREQILATRWGAPTVWMVHAPLLYAPHRLIVAPLLKRASTHASAIVTITSELARSMAQAGMPRSRIHVIANSVARIPDAGAPLAARSGRIGVASRLTRAKGVQHLIAAMPAILREHPFATLTIAGSGRYEGALRAQVRRLRLEERIQFTGYLPDTGPFFNQLSVFVCPSAERVEGLPTVILEAMRAGVPVVATAGAGAVVEVVIDRRTGLLASQANPEQLAQCVNALLSDARLATALAAAGQELVRARYTFDRTTSQFLHLLASIEEDEHDGDGLRNTSMEVRQTQGASLLRNTSVFFFSKVLTALATAFWTVLAARSLLPAQFGNLMLAAGMVELGAVITDAGLTSVATRDLASTTPQASRATIGALIYLKLGLGALAAATILGIAVVAPFEADARKVMYVLGPSLVFVSLQSLTLIFRARLSTNYVLVGAFVGALVCVWGAALVYWTASTPLRFAVVRLAMVCVAGMLTLFLVIVLYRPTARPNWTAMRRMLGASLLLGLALVLNILYYRIDVPLLALMTDSTQVAIYASAYRILDVVTLLPVAAAGVALPIMAALRAENRRHLTEFTRQYLELAVAVGLFIAVALTIFRGPILTFLYGGAYDDAAPTLLILAWVAAATLVTNVFTPLAVALDRQRLLLAVTALGLVVNLAMNLALIPRYGAIAAAVATLATEIAVTVPLMFVAVRRLHLRLVTRPLVASAAATSVALLVSALGTTLALGAWTSGAVALVAWLVVTFLIAPLWIPRLIHATRARRLTPPTSMEQPARGAELEPALSRRTP